MNVIKKTKKMRPISMLLVMLIMLTLVPTTAFAKGPSGILPRNGILDLRSDALSYQSTNGTTKTVNMNTTSVTDSAEGWSWDSTAKTLTLAGVNITGTEGVERGAAIRTRDDATTTIILAPGTENHLKGLQEKGTNLTTSTALSGYSITIGVSPPEQELHIKGSGGLTLETSYIAAESNQVQMMAIYINGAIKISGSVEINITTADASSKYSGGIYNRGIYSGGMEICENAKVSVKTGAAQALDNNNSLAESIGLKNYNKSTEILIKDNAIVNLHSGKVTNDNTTTPGRSAGLFSRYISIQGNSRVTAVASTECAGKVSSYGVRLNHQYDYEDTKMTVSGDASLIAKGSDCGIAGRGQAYYDDKLIIGDNAVVTATSNSLSAEAFLLFKCTFNGGCLTASGLKGAMAKAPVLDSALTYTVTAGESEALAQAVAAPVEATYTGSKYVQIKKAGYNGITPGSAEYDKDTATAGLSFVITPAMGSALSSIKNGTAELTKYTDYTVSGNTYTIQQSYLQSQPKGTLTLTFDMDNGNDPVALIAVSGAQVPIASVALDIGTPVAGAALAATVTCTTTGVRANPTVTWTPNVATAEYSTQYTVSVILTPEDDYEFAAGTTVTVNGENAGVTSNSDGTVTVTYQFPATGSSTPTPGGGSTSGTSSSSAGSVAPIERPDLWREFIKATLYQIGAAKEGETVTIKFGGFNALTLSVMKQMAMRRDLTIKMVYCYKGAQYNLTFPAGMPINYSEDIPYYGPLKLADMAFRDGGNCILK